MCMFYCVCMCMCEICCVYVCICYILCLCMCVIYTMFMCMCYIVCLCMCMLYAMFMYMCVKYTVLMYMCKYAVCMYVSDTPENQIPTSALLLKFSPAYFLINFFHLLSFCACLGATSLLAACGGPSFLLPLLQEFQDVNIGQQM